MIVQFDSWHASNKLLKFIHRQHWQLICAVKFNRNLDKVNFDQTFRLVNQMIEKPEKESEGIGVEELRDSQRHVGRNGTAAVLEPRPTKKERRYDIDWLRALAVIVLILNHSAAIFDPYPVTAIKGQSSKTMAMFGAFTHEWRLALLFLVSGAGTFFALGLRNRSQFVKERVGRLLIPLVFGILAIAPLQIYCWLRASFNYQHSYAYFYKSILSRLILHGGWGDAPESLHWAHLWFLAYLFIFSILALPLFLYLKQESGKRALSNASGFFARRGAIFLFAVPIVIIQVTLRATWPGSLNFIDDWTNVCTFLCFFIFGFLIISDERLGEAITRNGTAALILGLITSTIFITVIFTGNFPKRGYNLGWTLLMILRGLNVWFWNVAFLSLARKYLNFNNRILLYMTEAVFPVYIVHLPILSLAAVLAVRLNIGVMAQYTIIVLLTLTISFLIVELIKRIGVIGFLFGLKSKPKINALKVESAPVTSLSVQP